MKEPWEIYHDEVLRELNRAAKEDLSFEEALKAERQVAQAVFYHLVEVLHWHSEDALDLVACLRNVAFVKDGDTERSYRERLRHAWTDWNLKRQ